MPNPDPAPAGTNGSAVPHPVEPQRASRGQAWRLIGSGALALGAVLLALYVSRLDLAGYAIRELLKEAGLTSAALRVAAVDMGRLVLADIQAGPAPGVAVRRLSLRYRPAGLLNRRIDRVDLEGLTLTLGDGADGLSLGALAALPRGRSNDGSDWTVAVLGLSDTLIALGGEIRARLTANGELVALGQDRYRGELRFGGTAGLGDGEPADLEGTLAFTASPSAVAEADLTLQVRRLTLPHLGTLELEVSAQIQEGVGRVSGRLLAPPGQVGLELAGAVPADGDWGSARARGTLDFALTDAPIEAVGLKLSAQGRAGVELDGTTLALKALEPIVLGAPSPIGPLRVELLPSDAPTLRAAHEGGRVRALDLRFAGARVGVGDRGYAIPEGKALLTVAPVPILALSTLSLAETGPAPRIPPLSMSGEARLGPAALVFSAKVAAAGGKARADLQGRWDRSTGTGRADIQLHPLRFVPGGLQPRELAPALVLPVSEVGGGLSVRGSLGWQGGRIDPDLQVRIEDLALRVERLRLKGIAGTIRLTGLDPPTTPPGQSIRIARIDAGVPLTGAEMRFQLDNRRRLRIEEAGVSLLGGRVSQSQGVLDIARQGYRGTLELAGISLQSLLDLAELEGATATGQLGGRIPIQYEGGALSVTDGTLATEAPGVLRYAPASAPAALGASGEGLELALQALKNFHYEVLSLEMDGDSGRGWRSKVHLAGKNPEFMEGYPFRFNINLSGDLDRVILSGLLGLTLAERIQDRLKQQ